MPAALLRIGTEFRGEVFLCLPLTFPLPRVILHSKHFVL